jgi:hypothetical protein
MNTDFNLPRAFEVVKDADEEIHWLGKPNFWAFITRGIPFLCIGLIWGAIDYFGFIRNMDSEMAGFAIPFFALHLFPFWASILNMVRLFLVHGNTYYAFSNKRLMMRSGFWGTDFKVIDYDKISDLEVNVYPIENSLGVGTIQAFSGRMEAASDVSPAIHRICQKEFADSPPDTAGSLRLELWAQLTSTGKIFRLTDFNKQLAGHERILTSDYAWGPSGKEIAVYYATFGRGSVTQKIDILKLDRSY